MEESDDGGGYTQLHALAGLEFFIKVGGLEREEGIRRIKGDLKGKRGLEGENGYRKGKGDCKRGVEKGRVETIPWNIRG